MDYECYVSIKQCLLESFSTLHLFVLIHSSKCQDPNFIVYISIFKNVEKVSSKKKKKKNVEKVSGIYF